MHLTVRRHCRGHDQIAGVSFDTLSTRGSRSSSGPGSALDTLDTLVTGGALVALVTLVSGGSLAK